MRFQIKFAGSDLSENVRLTECEIKYGLSGEIGTAKLTLIVDQTIVSRYGAANFGAANYSLADVQNMDTVEIFNADTSDKLFSGYASRIEYERRAPSIDEWHFECQDHTLLLDTVVVNQTWTNKTDQYIIQDAFGSLLAEVNTTNVTSTQTLATFEAKDLTLRKLLDKLKGITGADWWLSPTKALYYDDDDFSAASFGLSDNPNGSTTFPYRLDSFKRDQSQLANRVTILGALVGGSELKVTVNDTADQTERGRVMAVTLVDRTIDNSSVLTAKANMELARRVAVQESGELSCWRDGLSVGQGVSVVSSGFAMNATYRIRGLEFSKVSEDEAEYRVTFGAENAELITLLRKFNEEVTKAEEVEATIPDGSIGDDKLDRVTNPIRITNADIVSIEFVKVNNVSIENADIVSVDFSKVDNVYITDSDIVSLSFAKVTGVAITDSQIVSVAFSKVTGVAITDSQIVSVAFSKVTGVLIENADIANLAITGSKIANLTISGGKLQDGTITSAKIASLEVDKVTSWSGQTIYVGSGVTFSGFVNITDDLTVDGVRANVYAIRSGPSAYTVINSSRGFVGQYVDVPSSVDAAGGFQISSSTVIDSSRRFVGSGGVNTSGNIETSGAFRMDGSDVINSSREFVGTECRPSSYVYAPSYRFAYTSESIALSGVTITKWIAAYSSGGTWLGKIPIIPP